jgi:hypothetical protein
MLYQEGEFSLVPPSRGVPDRTRMAGRTGSSDVLGAIRRSRPARAVRKSLVAILIAGQRLGGYGMCAVRKSIGASE